MANRDFYHTGLQVSRSQLAALLAYEGIGNKWYVDYATGSDLKSGKTWGNALKTVSEANDRATSNNNDLIFINGYSTVVESAMLDISKNRLHFINPNWMGGHFGASVKIQCTATTGATNIATMKNTGVRNTFTGIKFISEMTISESVYGVVEAGEYAEYHGCEIYKSEDLDVTGAAELLLNGDSAKFYNCAIGSTANEISGAVIRPAVLCTATISGKKLRDCYFENTLFLRKMGNAANRFIYGANATDVERMLLFSNCKFVNNILGTTDGSYAIGMGAAQTEGTVIADSQCTYVGVGAPAEGSRNIYVSGPVTTFATSGLAKLS